MNVFLERVPDYAVLSASFKGVLSIIAMQTALREIEVALQREGVSWLLIRTHELESLEAPAADAFFDWVVNERDGLDGIGYCPLSDDGVYSRTEIAAAMMLPRDSCTVGWVQSPNIGTVLWTIKRLQRDRARTLRSAAVGA